MDNLQQIAVDPSQALSAYSQMLANANHELAMTKAALAQANARIAELTEPAEPTEES